MTIKWGILGASGIAHRRTMSAINESKNGKLQALMVRDIERARKLALEHGAESYYDSVDNLLSDPEVDATYIATPVYLHCEHVIKSAEHGKPVLCEKPMAMNVDECRRMIDACKQNGVQLQVCFLLRFHQPYQEIKKLIEDGELGEIIEARASLLKSYEIGDGLWRRDPEKAGGGVLMDMGSHAIDLLCYLLGNVSRTMMLADSRIREWEVEETATVLMQMESGAHAIINASFVVPYSDIALEIYGTKGSVIVYSGQRAEVELHIDNRIMRKPNHFINLYKPLVEHFGRCLEGREEPMSPGIAGLKNIQIINSAYESAIKP